MPTLTLLRHGQSEWNKENRFTGWVDVDLSEEGIRQAQEAGRLIKENAIPFSRIYTSYLLRATRTLWEVQSVTGTHWMPVETDWRLNERHYGALQGKNKDETREKYGAEQVQIWRRSYATPPPSLEEPQQDEDGRYAGMEIPRGESLKDTLTRVMPCWEECLKPDLVAGKDMLVVAHGNSLRSLAKHLDGMDDDEIMKFEIPTGIPLVYVIDEGLRVVSRQFIEAE